MFADWLKRCPLVAILRGVKPAEALDIGSALTEAGFCIVEVPLNSPAPFASIMTLSNRFGFMGIGFYRQFTHVDVGPKASWANYAA